MPERQMGFFLHSLAFRRYTIPMTHAANIIDDDDGVACTHAPGQPRYCFEEEMGKEEK